MNDSRVLWIKVWGIAGLQGAITLSWVIYNLYLPLLLVQLGWSKEVAIALLIGENALEAFIEPLSGMYSDRQKQFFGSRIPIINIGIILSSVLFLTLPSLVIFNPDNSSKLAHWLLPILAVAWASAMAIFRSPAMAILRSCSSIPSLPQAASVLTLVGGIVGAFRFDAYGAILNLGAGFAFALGSFCLLITGAALRWLNPPEAPSIMQNKSKKVSLLRLGLICVTGMAVAWGLRFLIPTVSQILAIQLSAEHSKLGMTAFFTLLGLSALPAGKIATKLGNSQAMMGGCWIIMIAIASSAFLPISWLQYIAISFLIFGFSLVLNGAIPYVLGFIPTEHSGLGLGMYFGGLNAGISLFSFIVSQLEKPNITTGTFGTILSFLLVSLCLFYEQSSRLRAS